MIEDKQVWAFERDYLATVIKEIKAQLNIGISAVEDYKSEAIRLQKSMWEDIRCAPASIFDLEDVAQINSLQMDLSNKASIYRFSYEKVNSLKMMLKSPYFARIDFFEKGEKSPEKIYIGINNLNRTDSAKIIVYDWRTPIAGMFYDFEVGPSSYYCPTGLIQGQLLLKRQYKIEDANIAYMFDSSLNINDTMLQEILGKSKDNKMKTIVTSIQKEQNSVIRNSRDKVLIVSGPAGSGKTSIALHRAAYLLYKYRETIRPENILIFSPNHVFEDYISDVLPELGEENIKRSTFADFFEGAFQTNKQIETINQQMEYILTAKSHDDIRLECIEFKASSLFLSAIKKYAVHIQDGKELVFKDIIYDGSVLLSADDIKALYKNQYSRLCYADRLGKIRQKLYSLLDEYEEKRKKALRKNKSSTAESSQITEQEAKAKYQELKSEIIQATSFDVYSAYLKFLNNIDSFIPAHKSAALKSKAFFGCTTRDLEQGIINYEDLAPIIYLASALMPQIPTGQIKHIIIDEAQDYTPLQYEIFKTVFNNCNMTILGDINQTINGYMNIGSFNAIADIFSSASHSNITLTKSYRSSKELSDFCRSLLIGQSSWDQLQRHGEKPKVIKASPKKYHKKMADDIATLKNKGYKSIAIICKTAARCKELYALLSPQVDIELVSSKNELFYSSIAILPSYLAKGLEFDAVLVDSIEDADYFIPQDRKLLYTICTRALHELYLYYRGTATEFIAAADKKLYDFYNLDQ